MKRTCAMSNRRRPPRRRRQDYADAKLDPPLSRHASIGFDHAALQFDRAAHGVDHAAKFGEDPSPLRLTTRPL
jgi:hypothetical protein